MTNSQRQTSRKNAAASLLTTIKWMTLLMCAFVLYGLYSFIQARNVVLSELAVVEEVFVINAGWMDRVGISIKGARYFMIWDFPLSPGVELIVERRENGEFYVCQLSRERCSKIRKL